MCFTLEIHGWIYHINPRQRLEKKKIKKKENKKESLLLSELVIKCSQ